MAFAKAIYKVLAHNDTGRAVGHQAGPLIPKNLQSYFPALATIASAAQPTVSHYITAELYDGATNLGTVKTRYQYQTWGAKRSPERRITSNLSGLLGNAKRDDILLVERDLSQADRYRLTLLRQGTAKHTAIKAQVGAKRWGFL